MAISDRIKAEARRTIDGMQRFYEKYSEEADDAEELEHRIARVEASMEGCNGLTQDEKIQKTAENVFELTCAQERSYDALRVEIRKTREEYKREFEDMKTQSAKEFSDLKSDIKTGLNNVMKKIEDSGCDSSSSMKNTDKSRSLMQLISKHPLLAFNSFIFLLIMVFVSGHFDEILRLFGVASSAAGAPAPTGN